MGAKYEAFIESEADGLDISILAIVPEKRHHRPAADRRAA